MTKLKSTKGALLLSALSLIMCASMLIGSTFAWFTDSVTAGRNKIVAGNLDVVLEYKKPNSNDWESVTGQTVLFGEDALWEPGHTEVVALRIRNAGTLALKYDLATTVYEEVAGTNEKDESFLLSEYLELGYSAIQQDGTVGDLLMGLILGSRDQAVALANSEFGASVDNPNPVIFPGEAHVCALAITMPETVGNEANYKTGTTPPSVRFGVTLLATQATVEKDSFDNQYDAEAEFPKLITSSSDLAKAAEEGGKYALGANIAMEESFAVKGEVEIDLNGYGIDAGENTSYPFEMADGASLTLNGSEELVRVGVYGLVNIPEGNDATVVLNGGKYVADTTAGSIVKPQGDGSITVVLKNVEYTDTSANGRVLDATAYNGENLNVVVEGGKYQAPIGFVMPSGSIKDAEITVTGNQNGYPAVYSIGDVTVENCTINSNHHAVSVSHNTTVTVKNCVVNAPAGCLAFQVYNTGGTIHVFDTSYTGNIGTTGPMKSGCVAVINIDGAEVYRKG